MALGQAFVFDNDSSGAVSIVDNASGAIDTVLNGSIDYIFLEDNSTAAGVWGKYSWLPAIYNFNNTIADHGGTSITNATWTGAVINSTYLPTFTLGSTAVTLGTTVATFAGVTLSSPTFVTPVLGTPSSGTLTSCTGLPNAGLVNSSVTLGSTAVSLGTTVATFSGVTLSSPTFVTPVLGTPSSGTLSSCTGYSAGSLSGGTLAAGVLASSLTSVGTLATLTVTATITGSVTGSAATFTSTSQNSQFNSVGVGTAGSTTAGEIRATNNVTAYYSSDRTLKENIQDIPNALEIAVAIGSKTFDWTDAYLEAHGGEDGYFVQKSDFGVIAQDVQKVFPIAVRTREDGTLAVDYEKLGTLAFAALNQLLKRVEALEAK